MPIARSYRSATIRYCNDDVVVWGHVLLPLIALRSLPAEGPNAYFRDEPTLIRHLSEAPPTRALTRGDLLTPLDHVDLSALSRSERREVAGWRSATRITTVGEVLFNDWD